MIQAQTLLGDRDKGHLGIPEVIDVARLFFETGASGQGDPVVQEGPRGPHTLVMRATARSMGTRLGLALDWGP